MNGRFLQPNAEIKKQRRFCRRRNQKKATPDLIFQDLTKQRPFLVEIDLTGIPLKSAGLFDCQLLTGCSQLKQLTLMDCGIQEIQNAHLLPETLIYLNVALNQLTSLSCIEAAISLINLQYLAIHGNHLRHEGDVQKCISSLSSLRHLIVTQNMSDSVGEALPVELWNPMCQVFYKDENQLLEFRVRLFNESLSLKSVDGVDRWNKVLDQDIWLNIRLDIIREIEDLEEQEEQGSLFHHVGFEQLTLTDAPHSIGIQTSPWLSDRATSPIPFEIYRSESTRLIQTDLESADIQRFQSAFNQLQALLESKTEDDVSTTDIHVKEEQLSEKVQCLQALLDKQIGSHTELQTRFRGQVSLNEALKEQHEKLAGAYEQLLNENKRLGDAEQSMKLEQERSCAEIKRLTDELQKQRQQYEADLSKKDREYSVKKKEWTREKESWNREREELLRKEQDLMVKNSTSEGSLHRIKELEAENSNLKKDVERMQFDKCSTEEKHKWERRQWRTMYQNLKSNSHTDTKNKRVEESESILKLQQFYEQNLKQATDHHVMQYNRLKAHYDQMKDGYGELEHVLEEQCLKFQNKIQELERTLNESRKENNQLRESNRAGRDKETKWKQVISELSDVVEQQRNQLTKIRTDWSKDRQESREWIERLQKKLDETDPSHLMHLQRLHKTEQERYNNEEVKWRQQKRELELQTEQLAAKIREWEERGDLLNRSLTERERAWTEQKQSLEQSLKIKERMVESAEASVKEWKTKYEEVKERMEKIDKSAVKERQELVRELKALEQANDEYNRQRLDMEEELTSVIQSESKLKQKLMRAEQSLEERETMMAMIEKEVIQMKERVKQQNEERDLQWRQLELDLENTRSKLTEQQEAYAQLEQERLSLISEKKQMEEEMRAVLSYMDALGKKQGQLDQIRSLLSDWTK